MDETSGTKVRGDEEGETGGIRGLCSQREVEAVVLDERCKGRDIPVIAPSFAHTNNSFPIV